MAEEKPETSSCASSSETDSKNNSFLWRHDLKWLFNFTKKNQCKLKDCSFEPGPHKRHKKPKRIISEQEKKVILRYLIKEDEISKAKGSVVWKNMRNSGYLTHRSPETLRNCLRRILLPRIGKYRLLPKDILDKFLELQWK